jgi:hypothetical protein
LDVGMQRLQMLKEYQSNNGNEYTQSVAMW